MSSKEEEKSKEEKRSLKFVLFASLTLVKRQPKWFILTTLSSLFYFMLPLGIALVTRDIFNKLEGYSGFPLDIWVIIALIPILYVFQAVTEVTFMIFVWKFVMSNQIMLQKNMISGVFLQPGADSLEKSPGEAISRFRGDVAELTWFSALIGDLIAFLMFATIAFFLMFNINKMVTLVVFVPFIIVIMLINSSRKKLTKFRNDARSAAGKITGIVGESFGAIQAIKVSSSEKHILNHFNKLNENRRTTAVKDSTLAASLRATGKVVVSISTGVILYMVASLMKTGEFTLGDFTLFIFLLNWLTGFIRFLGEFMAWSQRNRVSYARTLKIMQGKTGFPEDEKLIAATPLYLDEKYPSIPPINRDNISEIQILEVQNLSYIYPGTEKGIKNVNFTIPQGSFTVIVGKVGSGKSTLLKVLLGLLKSDDGTILWNSKEVLAPEEFFIPPITAYTSQIPILFSESIKNNILFGLPEDSVDMELATKLAIVDKEIDGFEDKFDTIIGSKGVKLSGGQKHRIAASRMFVREPQLLVFDDLSSALDVKTEEKLWEGLFDNLSSTFLVTSHRKFVLKKASQIIVMKDGEVIDIGNLEELLERSSEMRSLWEEDFVVANEGQKVTMSETYSKKTDTRHIAGDGESYQYTRKEYPKFLMDQISTLTDTFYGRKISQLMESMIDTALIDDKISSDELNILKQVFSNVSDYLKILNKAFEDGIIDDNERKELEASKEIVLENAKKVANEDKFISDDEKKLLQRISEIIEELKILESPVMD
ncbi:MAG: ABC transporter ATP-binding protein/permease [Candidatus Heimdallarchaeota archaeon]|nr:ABC transporter ATP-binding protein/permease [Candidatus Heimdallarchaeota archaeon]